MARLTTMVGATVGLAVGILTFRELREALRKRNEPPETAREEAERAADEAVTEASAAVEHAGAALREALHAGAKTVEHVSEKRADHDADGPDSDSSGRGGRLRRVGKGWIRR